MSITAVLLNWNRPFNVKNVILPFLSKHPFIDEIIISHGKKDTAFDFYSPFCRIVHRNDHWLNDTYGLSLRFIAALEAKNDHLLFLDDDLLVFNKNISQLYRFFIRDTEIIHGIYGRNTRPNYSIKKIMGSCPIVLTKVLFAHKSKCHDFFKFEPIVRTRISSSKPLWNGEDIFLSLVSVKTTGRLNFAKNIGRLRLFYSEINGISSHPNHLSYRQQITRYFLNALELDLNI